VAHNELVPFQVTICGIDELAGHCAGGVTHVLSILDPGWPEPEPLSIFDLNRRLKLRFHDVIEPRLGWIAPERWDVELLLAFGRDLVASRGTHLLIHCHAGVSRSTASMALILAQALPDVAASRIFAEILRIRPQAWPNLRILELGDAQLNRRGELVAAAGGIYRAQLDRRQYLVEQMRSGGRGREIEAAAG